MESEWTVEQRAKDARWLRELPDDPQYGFSKIEAAAIRHIANLLPKLMPVSVVKNYIAEENTAMAWYGDNLQSHRAALAAVHQWTEGE